jgi:hypothetical protein
MSFEVPTSAPEALTGAHREVNPHGQLARAELAPAARSEGFARDLLEHGFVVIPGPVPPAEMPRLADAYDTVVAAAAAEDVSIRRTTTCVHDLVNRGAAFDGLYVRRPSSTPASARSAARSSWARSLRGPCGRGPRRRPSTSTSSVTAMGGGSFALARIPSSIRT